MSDINDIISRISEVMEIDNRKKVDKEIEECQRTIESLAPSFSSSQLDSLRSIIVKTFYSAINQSFVERILKIMIDHSDYRPQGYYLKCSHLSAVEESDIVFDLLGETVASEGIISEQDDNLYYAGTGTMYFGQGRGSFRAGPLWLSKHRLVKYGPFHSSSDVGYRLYYDDHESRPYLGSFDFIEYSGIHSLENIWKLTQRWVKFKYHTKYVQMKGHTIYGPLFFKADLGRFDYLKEGDIEIRLTLYQPSDTLRECQQELHNTIREKLTR